MIVLVYNLAAAALDLVYLRRVARAERPTARRVLGAALVHAALVSALGLAAVLGRPALSGFLALRLVAWGVFLHVPLCALAAAWCVRRARPDLARLGVAAAVVIWAVAVDAFWIEPRRLQLTHHVIASPRVRSRLRIAVLADIQTDVVGAHEEAAVRMAADVGADLVLLPGDFIQTSNARERPEPPHDRLQAELAALLAEADLAAPLGCYAVEGDIDPPDWRDAFDGVDVAAPAGRATFRLRDDVVLTTLPLAASHAVDPRVPRPPGGGLHVVVGHGPNFALGDDVDADLLVAGHTHGGQVQFPFVGPLLTLSRVPRAWAAGGLTEVRDGVHLVVSRGVGLERGSAPRLRFLCPPEVVVIDVVPARGDLPAGERR